MLKKDLRLIYAQKRSEISEQSLLNSSLSIANQMLTISVWSLEYYHLYLPISAKNEIDTSFILSILQGKDKNVVLPKVDSKKKLKHFLLLDSTQLVVNSWGVPEPVDGIEISPSKIDVVIIPLLAYDKIGNRVGYGKGFYDVFLSSCRPETIKIGLSVFPPEDKITDVEATDIALDYCVTPERVYSFSKT